MKKLYIKQKVFSLGEKFTVKDDQERDAYYVEGSFMQVPKTFTIINKDRKEIAIITKKVFSLLPKFFVEVNGRAVVTIEKEFSFFKSRYRIDGEGITVNGNWLDMDFEILQYGKVIGSVSKEWFTWGDSYKVEVLNEELETIVISTVIAIDCVKSDHTAAASATT